MKSSILIFTIFEIILVNSFTQRNLKYTMDEKHIKFYQKLLLNFLNKYII